ncbi:hypothetical protein [Lactobacillus sp. Sy-1]|uniref:hypothetical protein n=1 Tax=Lactobacillus sp. Sy-1 TaxID=2109645 RepID=UPI001C5A8EDF|nr:hypothetical protein [Lactobacillus sp. Sy-1]MBW1605891.1 hypothetical protein [Lactobacillus sp. Sy-1]
MKFRNLTLSIATLLLMASTLSLLTTTKANAATWKTGVPPVISKSTSWRSDFIKAPAKYRTNKYYYTRVFTPLSKTAGFNPVTAIYTKSKKFVGNGGNAGVDASIYPHYQSIGHGYYKVTAGGESHNNKKSLSYELHSTLNHDDGETVLIKVHNSKQISIWSYENKTTGKQDYRGLFRPYNGNIN